jgi:glycine cleavage system H protein
MNFPTHLKYTTSHEWINVEADGTLTVGITEHAQEALGDIVFLELPNIGSSYKATQSCATIESVKAASDIYCPIEGEIIAQNEEAVNAPEQINSDAFGVWLFKIKPTGDVTTALSQLLSSDQYQKEIGM